MSLQHLAQHVRGRGRNGDTELVHMTRGEVDGLHALARSMYGRDLPINPETGLHEASWLKKLLPTLAGAAATYFTGSPAAGAAAGALVGGYQNRKTDALGGAVAGGLGGYGGGQGVMALNTAGGGAAGASPTMSNMGAGIQQLWKDPSSVVGTAADAKTGAAATGLGGSQNALRAAGMALAPMAIQDPSATPPPGMTPEQAAVWRKEYEKKFAPQYSLKRTYNPQGPSYFSYEREPIRGAAGGAVGYAAGGKPRRGADITTAPGTKAYTSASSLNMLQGGEDAGLLRLLGPQYRQYVAPATPGGGDAVPGGGGTEVPREPVSSGGDTGVPGKDPLEDVRRGVADAEEADRANDTEFIGNTVDISGGNRAGYADSDWVDPDTGRSGTMGNTGWVGAAFGDTNNPSGSGLSSTGEYLSDLGGDLVQAEYDNPNLAWIGGVLIDKLTGLPFISNAIGGGLKAIMNADPTNVHGVNAVNGMDQDSDVAHQAAADDQETQRLINRGNADAADTNWTNATEDARAGNVDSGAGDYSWAAPDPSGEGAYGTVPDNSAWGGNMGTSDYGMDEVSFGGGRGDYGFAGGDYGGGFGGGCVQVDSVLPDGVRAGDIRVGDAMVLADGETLEPGTGIVTYSERRLERGWRLTAGGVTLVCSASAPIPTRNGLKIPRDLLHEYVAVLKGDEAGWFPVHAEPIGDIEVQHITVGNKCFWAGETADGFILHHNMKVADGGGGGWDTAFDDYWAEGGVVGLESGGFVFPADVVAALGAGSSGAGLEVLAQRFGARPVQGKGHGQSDDVHATIDGQRAARVARDEAVLNAEQVARVGGGNPEKGAKKLYAMMDRIRKQATGSHKQMRPVNVNSALR